MVCSSFQDEMDSLLLFIAYIISILNRFKLILWSTTVLKILVSCLMLLRKIDT